MKKEKKNNLEPKQKEGFLRDLGISKKKARKMLKEDTNGK